jgi:phenylpropionate dioxygenase-like ring-hydroxylating dioxygenase large terminal subunit
VIDNEHPALAAFWHPVAASRDLGAGPLRVTLLGRDWVLARIDGDVVAMPDRCPHRLAPLSAGTVEGDRLRCAYHGYAFDRNGRCVEVPAQEPDIPISARAAAGTAAGVTERYGLVWLAPEEPRWALPELPEWDDPAWSRQELVATWNAGAAQMADNFLDVAHFPFTHRGSFGDPSDRIVPDYEVTRSGWSFTARHEHRARHVDDRGTYGEYQGRIQEYTYTPPHTVHLLLTHTGDATQMSMAFFMQPIDRATTRLWVIDFHKDAAARGVDEAQLQAARLQVTLEDKDLLERFPHKWLPLEPTDEFHTKADRITVELRRVLREIVTQ